MKHHSLTENPCVVLRRPTDTFLEFIGKSQSLEIHFYGHCLTIPERKYVEKY